MKAKSIVTIRDMLKRERDAAYMDYKNTKEHLEEKYETEWIDNKINDFEKEELNDVKEKYRKLNEAYEDFEEHEW